MDKNTPTGLLTLRIRGLAKLMSSTHGITDPKTMYSLITEYWDLKPICLDRINHKTTSSFIEKKWSIILTQALLDCEDSLIYAQSVIKLS